LNYEVGLLGNRSLDVPELIVLLFLSALLIMLSVGLAIGCYRIADSTDGNQGGREEPDSTSSKKEKQSQPNTEESQEYKKLIALVRKIDKNFERRIWFIQLNPSFVVYFGSLIVAIGIVGYLLWLIAQVISAGSSLIPLKDLLGLLLGEVGTLIAFLSLGVSVARAASPERIYELLVDYNYKKYCRKFKGEINETDKFLVRALVMMRSKQPGLSLETYFEQRKSSLNSDFLLDLLYKQG
jgi:hypothetical protein